MLNIRTKVTIGLCQLHCRSYYGSSRLFMRSGFSKLLSAQYECTTPLSTVFDSSLDYRFGISSLLSSSFCTSIKGKRSDAYPVNDDEWDENSDNEHDHLNVNDGTDEHKCRINDSKEKSGYEFHDLETIMSILKDTKSSGSVMKSKLEECTGMRVTNELVVEVLSRVQNNWEAAFTFFLWAGKQPDYWHSVRGYHTMISILGKVRKFDTAWSLVEEMKNGKDGSSMVTPQTLLIMIRKYCAVHDVGKAIGAFYAFKRFKFDIGAEDFEDLLQALCHYKNVKDAEHLLFCNKNSFPLTTKSFNIILNGWCNAVGDLREASRIWREMDSRRIMRDVYSYSSMMACNSKYGRLNGVLRLFDEMKRLNITPDSKVYNAVIHALAKAKHVKEAWNLMKTMEKNGILPNVVTYNSLIMPLCKRRLSDEAREVFNKMIEKGISPTTRTYHAFIRIQRIAEDVFDILKNMREMRCYPNRDTYIMLIRKFCRWRQLDNVFKIWNEMSFYGLDHDRSSYIVLIHGLFLNGKLEESYDYYLEMKKKHLLPEPKIEEMLRAWLEGKETEGIQDIDLKGSPTVCIQKDTKSEMLRAWLEGKETEGIQDIDLKGSPTVCIQKDTKSEMLRAWLEGKKTEGIQDIDLKGSPTVCIQKDTKSEMLRAWLEGKKTEGIQDIDLKGSPTVCIQKDTKSETKSRKHDAEENCATA